MPDNKEINKEDYYRGKEDINFVAEIKRESIFFTIVIVENGEFNPTWSKHLDFTYLERQIKEIFMKTGYMPQFGDTYNFSFAYAFTVIGKSFLVDSANEVMLHMVNEDNFLTKFNW